MKKTYSLAELNLLLKDMNSGPNDLKEGALAGGMTWSEERQTSDSALPVIFRSKPWLVTAPTAAEMRALTEDTDFESLSANDLSTLVYFFKSIKKNALAEDNAALAYEIQQIWETIGESWVSSASSKWEAFTYDNLKNIALGAAPVALNFTLPESFWLAAAKAEVEIINPLWFEQTELTGETLISLINQLPARNCLLQRSEDRINYVLSKFTQKVEEGIPDDELKKIWTVLPRLGAAPPRVFSDTLIEATFARIGAITDDHLRSILNVLVELEIAPLEETFTATVRDRITQLKSVPVDPSEDGLALTPTAESLTKIAVMPDKVDALIPKPITIADAIEAKGEGEAHPAMDVTPARTDVSLHDDVTPEAVEAKGEEEAKSEESAPPVEPASSFEDFLQRDIEEITDESLMEVVTGLLGSQQGVNNLSVEDLLQVLNLFEDLDTETANDEWDRLASHWMDAALNKAQLGALSYSDKLRIAMSTRLELKEIPDVLEPRLDGLWSAYPETPEPLTMDKLTAALKQLPPFDDIRAGDLHKIIVTLGCGSGDILLKAQQLWNGSEGTLEEALTLNVTLLSQKQICEMLDALAKIEAPLSETFAGRLMRTVRSDARRFTPEELERLRSSADSLNLEPLVEFCEKQFTFGASASADIEVNADPAILFDRLFGKDADFDLGEPSDSTTSDRAAQLNLVSLKLGLSRLKNDASKNRTPRQGFVNNLLHDAFVVSKQGFLSTNDLFDLVSCIDLINDAYWEKLCSAQSAAKISREEADIVIPGRLRVRWAKEKLQQAVTLKAQDSAPHPEELKLLQQKVSKIINEETVRREDVGPLNDLAVQLGFKLPAIRAHYDFFYKKPDQVYLQRTFNTDLSSEVNNLIFHESISSHVDLSRLAYFFRALKQESVKEKNIEAQKQIRHEWKRIEPYWLDGVEGAWGKFNNLDKQNILLASSWLDIPLSHKIWEHLSKEERSSQERSNVLRMLGIEVGFKRGFYSPNQLYNICSAIEWLNIDPSDAFWEAANTSNIPNNDRLRILSAVPPMGPEPSGSFRQFYNGLKWSINIPTTDESALALEEYDAAIERQSWQISRERATYSPFVREDRASRSEAPVQGQQEHDLFASPHEKQGLSIGKETVSDANPSQTDIDLGLGDLADGNVPEISNVTSIQTAEIDFPTNEETQNVTIVNCVEEMPRVFPDSSSEPSLQPHEIASQSDNSLVDFGEAEQDAPAALTSIESADITTDSSGFELDATSSVSAAASESDSALIGSQDEETAPLAAIENRLPNIIKKSKELSALEPDEKHRFARTLWKVLISQVMTVDEAAEFLSESDEQPVNSKYLSQILRGTINPTRQRVAPWQNKLAVCPAWKENQEEYRELFERLPISPGIRMTEPKDPLLHLIWKMGEGALIREDLMELLDVTKGQLTHALSGNRALPVAKQLDPELRERLAKKFQWNEGTEKEFQAIIEDIRQKDLKKRQEKVLNLEPKKEDPSLEDASYLLWSFFVSGLGEDASMDRVAFFIGDEKSATSLFRKRTPVSKDIVKNLVVRVEKFHNTYDRSILNKLAESVDMQLSLKAEKIPQPVVVEQVDEMREDTRSVKNNDASGIRYPQAIEAESTMPLSADESSTPLSDKTWELNACKITLPPEVEDVGEQITEQPDETISDSPDDTPPMLTGEARGFIEAVQRDHQRRTLTGVHEEAIASAAKEVRDIPADISLELFTSFETSCRSMFDPDGEQIAFLENNRADVFKRMAFLLQSNQKLFGGELKDLIPKTLVGGALAQGLYDQFHAAAQAVFENPTNASALLSQLTQAIQSITTPPQNSLASLEKSGVGNSTEVEHFIDATQTAQRTRILSENHKLDIREAAKTAAETENISVDDAEELMTRFETMCRLQYPPADPRLSYLEANRDEVATTFSTVFASNREFVADIDEAIAITVENGLIADAAIKEVRRQADELLKWNISASGANGVKELSEAFTIFASIIKDPKKGIAFVKKYGTMQPDKNAPDFENAQRRMRMSKSQSVLNPVS